MSKMNQTPDFSAMWAQLKKDLVDIAATEGVNFFQETFDKQGFTDVAFTPWEPKKHPDGYNILLRSGYLKNSIQVFEKTPKRIVIGSDAEYAQIHNEGGILIVRPRNTPKAKKFFWAMYKTTGQMHWKYMAMSRKPNFEISIKIPQRQFIGESQTLLNIIENKFKHRLNKALNKLK